MADDVKKLLSDYIVEHRAGGEADPIAFIERAPDPDRAELAELIDAYLARSPGREWDAEAFAGSSADGFCGISPSKSIRISRGSDPCARAG